jgi:heat shock protein HslJ
MARALMTAVIAALVMAAPAAASSPLEGTSWTFQSVGGRAMPAKHPVQLRFAAKRFGGDDDRNRFGGRYRAGAEHLRFGDIKSTAIGCEFGGPARPDWNRALMRTCAYRLAAGSSCCSAGAAARSHGSRRARSGGASPPRGSARPRRRPRPSRSAPRP